MIFEKDFYADTGLDVTFVGHPLVESVEPELDKKTFFDKNNLSNDKPLVGLLPGSRKNEILNILPVMIEAAYSLSQKRPDVQFLLPIGPAVPRDKIDAILQSTHRDKIKQLRFAQGQVHETMAYSDMVMIASGTATLETACFATPMAIIYKVTFITYILARMVIRIPYIGLVNVVARKKIIPEFIQHEACPSAIAECVLEHLNDSQLMENKRKELKQIRQKLGKPGAVHRAAEAVISFLANLNKTTKETVV